MSGPGLHLVVSGRWPLGSGSVFRFVRHPPTARIVISQKYALRWEILSEPDSRFSIPSPTTPPFREKLIFMEIKGDVKIGAEGES
jgi:hypothetical protein